MCEAVLPSTPTGSAIDYSRGVSVKKPRGKWLVAKESERTDSTSNQRIRACQTRKAPDSRVARTWLVTPIKRGPIGDEARA